LSGIGAAAAIGFLLVWTMSLTKPVSAMEKMAAEIRKAKSYRYAAIETKRKTRMTGYWLAPDSVRLDITDPSRWKGPGPEISNIVPGLKKPWITINNRAKTFCRFPPRGTGFSPLERLDNFGKFSGNADRELGTKEISGRKARGFVIDTEKIDPDIPPQMMEIWIDDETNLPVFLRCDRRGSMTTETSDIRWNVDLDPKLFDPTPPQGYTDVTPKPPASDEEVRLIIEGLRTYAEASGGYYPRVKRVDSNTSGDLIKMLGGGDVYLKEPTADTLAAAKHAIKAFERIPEAKRRRASRAFQGIVQIGHIQVHNADAAYYGATVGPKDKGKVLLRWKLDDGRYEVIFGDLRAETVTAERLHTLEGK
jgi:outer membrane lipoprotein-sorting protein